MSEPIKMYLHTVTPIHIGCDEVYEPMRFVIDEERQMLIAFDPLEFFRNLDAKERNTLATISKKGTVESLLEIYKFMRCKRFNGHEVELCQEFVKHYQKTLSVALHDKRKIQQELNNLTIARTAFNPNTDKPYIPGSGIKGALRTAYLNLLAATHTGEMSRERATARDLEKTLLDGGSFETDPFRMLKVSDFVPVGQGKTKIVYAVNEKKKTSKFEARGPYQIVEVIEPGSFFQGWITIEQPDQKAGIANPITQKKLLESLNQFYENEKSREDKELNAIEITPLSIPDNNGWLVRIGRHSGAESITIEGHRNIKIMKGKGTPPAFSKNGATTFWLASEEEKPKIRGKLKPFGWAVLGDVTEDVEKSFKQIETVNYEEIRLRQAQQEEHSQTHGNSLPGHLIPPAVKKEATVTTELWTNATLTWNRGNDGLTAKHGGKTAIGKGKEHLSESLQSKLIKSKKPVTANVTVEPYGNALKIVKIEMEKGLGV